ncbi:MAG: glycosyltransferase family 87 protein [Planctomycetota bacterium]
MLTDKITAPNSSDSLNRPAQPWRYFWWFLITIIVVWQATICVRNARLNPAKPDKVSDFTAFYGAGQLALRGQNIYDFKNSEISRRPYLYPATFAIFPMMPLALMKHNTALVVFVILNFMLFFATLWLLRDVMWRLIPQTAPPLETSRWMQWLRHPDSGVMLAAVICLRFVMSNMRHGNANMYVAFALALGLWLMLKRRTALFEISSGLAIALGTAIKVTPGLFGLYLLWTWRPWGMLGGALGLVFFIIIVPAIPLGFTYSMDRFWEYKNHVASAATGEDAEDDPIGHDGGADQKQLEGGISLRGICMRYMTPRAMKFVFPDKTTKLYYANIVTLPENTARNVCRAGELILLALTVFLTMRKIARTDPAGIALSWGLTANAMLLISPLTRKAHVCSFLITAVVTIALMQQNRITGRARTFCIATLAALCFQGAIFSVEIIGKLNSDWLQGIGVGFWLLLATFASTAWALWKLEQVRDC